MNALLRLQRYTLFLFAFSINFEMYDPFNTGGAFSIAKLTGFIYFLSVLPVLDQYLRVDGIKAILSSIWIFYFLLTLMNLINLNYFYSTVFNLSILQNIILFWILLNHERIEKGILQKSLLAYALGSIALALLFTFGIGVEIEGVRVTVFGDNQNVIGMRMSVSVIILLVAAFQNIFSVGLIRYILLLPIPFMINLMAQTGSRAAFFSFIIAFVLGIILYQTKYTWQKLLVMIAGVFLSIFAIQYVFQFEILRDRVFLFISEGDSAGRDAIWRALFSLIKRNPVFGVGETGYYKYTMIFFGRLMSAHNVFLEVMCYTGIVGLIVYLFFLSKIAFIGVRYFFLNRQILQVLILIPILALLLTHQILYVKIAWLIFSFVISRNYYLNEKSDKVKWLVPRIQF